MKMTATTEIYLCKAGQTLDQGRVEYSDSIDNRADAEADAIQRCKWDRKLAKVAYYALGDDGDFRIIFTYINPNPDTGEGRKKPRKAKKKAIKKPGLAARAIAAIISLWR